LEKEENVDLPVLNAVEDFDRVSWKPPHAHPLRRFSLEPMTRVGRLRSRGCCLTPWQIATEINKADLVPREQPAPSESALARLIQWLGALVRPFINQHDDDVADVALGIEHDEARGLPLGVHLFSLFANFGNRPDNRLTQSLGNNPISH
jgi:hypothetical protein